MGNKKSNQNPGNKPEPVNEPVEQVDETPEETIEETTETSEEATEETPEETPEAKELEDKILLCETAISAKGSSMKWLREVYCKIEKDPQKRINLANLGDSPAARQHIVATAQEFLDKCTKK